LAQVRQSVVATGPTLETFPCDNMSQALSPELSVTSAKAYLAFTA